MDEQEAYEQKWKARIDEWKAKIDFLEAKAEQAEADTKVEIQKQIEDLREKEKIARTRLEEIRQSGSEAWSDMSRSMETAVENLKDGIEQALDRFK
ncbi:MAG TPA: hypothetical protein VJ882_00470 [Desulfuromonadales bacterium]|nr:hypothetical protein [Desulfuromonadales bacterium]